MAIATSLINRATIDGVKKLEKCNPPVSRLFDNLSEYGDLILVGGAVRDFAYQRKPRDLDIIVDSDFESFDNALKNFTYKKNRFDGYKVLINDLELDIWSIQNNWAFREKILKPNVKNIPQGAFYNFDSISINLNTGDVYADDFIKSIRERKLDITLNEDYISLNPSPEVNIVRAFVIKKYWGLNFSNKVSYYINEWLSKVEKPYELLKNAEVKHYGFKKLNNEDYKVLF
ncbi:hypothetical protein [Oceanobacillus picturae]|uniref:hypothetical protein n=1 Tax=Oceanobacillus picturae TaxID=171693 RepID=UPI000E693384|nr:hypothetical protein [Oceanobacillus picturae]RIU93442.1 hypothetical protein D1864_08225 [Oceanobacillus picturae]